MNPLMLEPSTGAGDAAGQGGSASMCSQTGSLEALGTNRAGSAMFPDGVSVSFPMGRFPTGTDPLNGAFPGFGSQFSSPQDLLEEGKEETFLTKVNNYFSLLQLDDEPCRRLLITAPQVVNHEKLHTVVNVCTPGLERFYRKENRTSPSHQHAMFVAEYNTKIAAANAMEILHGLKTKLFDCPGQFFVKFY